MLVAVAVAGVVQAEPAVQRGLRVTRARERRVGGRDSAGGMELEGRESEIWLVETENSEAPSHSNIL